MPVELQNMILGSILPSIIDVINAKVTASRWRFWISIVLCVFAGAVFNIEELKYGDLTQFLSSVTVVVVSAQAVYKKLYEGSRVQTKIRTTINNVV